MVGSRQGSRLKKSVEFHIGILVRRISIMKNYCYCTSYHTNKLKYTAKKKTKLGKPGKLVNLKKPSPKGISMVGWSGNFFSKFKNE